VEYEILKAIKNAQGIHGYARIETVNDYDVALARMGELALTFPASELVLVEIKPIKFSVQVETLKS
jgi:hypothetical protein